MKYRLIDPENKHLRELEEYGFDIVQEVCDFVPDEMDRIFTAIENDIKINEFKNLFRQIHMLRSHFRYFVSPAKPEFQYINQVENELYMINKQTGSAIEPEIINQIIEMIAKVKDIGAQLKTEIGAFAVEYPQR